MLRRTMTMAMIVAAFVLLTRICSEAAGVPDFDPKDPKVQDITIVNDALDTFIDLVDPLVGAIHAFLHGDHPLAEPLQRFHHLAVLAAQPLDRFAMTTAM